MKVLSWLQRYRLGRKDSRQAKCRKLRMECLETRAVFAVGAVGFVEGDALTIIGDDSSNEIYVRLVNGNITIDGGQFVTTSGVSSTLTASSVSSIQILAGGGDDTVIVDPLLTASMLIDGGDGNDVIVGGGGTSEIYGGAGNDTLYASNGGAILFGQAGADKLYGSSGNDTAWSGAGTDQIASNVEKQSDFSQTDTIVTAIPTKPILSATPSTTTPATLGALRVPTNASAALVGDVLILTGTQGDDTLTLVQSNGQVSLSNGLAIQTDSGAVSSVAAASIRRIVAIGYSGNDTIDLSAVSLPTIILGADGDDTLIGSKAADAIFGGAGIDKILGGGGDDKIYAGAGNDVVTAGGGNDAVWGSGGNDTINGGDGDDQVFGDAGDDKLFGDLGKDTISGGSGADQLDGGQGADSILGGSDSDSAVTDSTDTVGADLETVTSQKTKPNQLAGGLKHSGKGISANHLATSNRTSVRR